MLRSRRESSLTLVNANSPGVNKRSSVMVTSYGLGSETAKYKREEAMKEISASFNKQFAETQRKYRVDAAPGEDTNEQEKMTRARAKIIGLPTAINSPWDDSMARRDCLR